jgi:hypothetical protein
MAFSTAERLVSAISWRYVLRRVRLPTAPSLLLVLISNPLWIALTAPGRWVSDR